MSIKENNLSFEEKLYRMFIPITKNLDVVSVQQKFEQADLDVDVSEYFSKNLFYSFFIAIMVFVSGSIISNIVPNLLISFSILFIISFVLFILYFVFSFLRPYIIINSKVNSIKNNLPLVILGMSSVAESGAPPEAIFSTSNVKDKNQYLNNEFSKIIYYIDKLGISLLEAIDIVAKKTPSFELKKFLLDLKSNLEAGGSLSDFMKKKADHAKFEYNLLLDNQNKKAELFGDIYSAVVIAGPLFLFSGIMLMGMVGGAIGGLSIGSLLAIGVFILVPVINILFIFLINLVGN
ncbi:MAG: type II secretion system F family protein [Candidatus ainarchaeum sp.]|nr:type II secretion system F family protein [Candidatus ainarchaeum sp.]MDD3976242.1 type II secretion system F family protein [Candidatus ainarchaeum sp.]